MRTLASGAMILAVVVVILVLTNHLGFSIGVR